MRVDHQEGRVGDVGHVGGRRVVGQVARVAVRLERGDGALDEVVSPQDDDARLGRLAEGAPRATVSARAVARHHVFRTQHVRHRGDALARRRVHALPVAIRLLLVPAVRGSTRRGVRPSASAAFREEGLRDARRNRGVVHAALAHAIELMKR